MSNMTPPTPAAAPAGTITVTFLHPRGPGKRPIALNRAITGKMAIDGLVSKKFIEPRAKEQAYALVLQRTKDELPLERSLMDAGVEDGDVIQVTELTAGARS